MSEPEATSVDASAAPVLSGTPAEAGVTSLYRRYRPRTFAELVGQHHVAQTLRNEVRERAQAHAYLFTGMRGTGKTSAARILARAVNCTDLRDGDPCNACAACVELLDGASVDVLEIDAASNRGIDEMRDLRDKVKYLPASLRCKVYIIDEAHMLTTEAWNAFLKTLEEPPPHVLFVLATTEPHKVPETVRSRVQRFDFRPVLHDDVVAHLRAVAAAEHVEIDGDALELLARAARGSLRDALSLLDQALAGGHTRVTTAVVQTALGLADPALVRDLLRALAAGDAAGALRACATATDAGADPRQLLRELARLARGAELVRLGAAAAVSLSADDAEVCASLPPVPRGFWLEALERFAATEVALRQPVDARLQFEHCLLRLTEAARHDDELAELQRRVAALELALHRVAGDAGVAVTGAGTVVAEGAPPDGPHGAATVRPEPQAAPAAARPQAATTAARATHATGAAGAAVTRERAAAAAPATPKPPAPAAPATPEPPATAVAAPEPAAPAAPVAPEPRAAAADTPEPAATAAAMPEPTAGAAATPEPTAAAAEPEPPTAATAGVAWWRESWPRLVAAIQRRDAMLAGILRDCVAVEAEPGRLVVATRGEFHFDRLGAPEKAHLLAETAAQLAGSPVVVETRFEGERRDRRRPAERAPGDGDAEDLSRQLLEQFPGSRIVATRLRDAADDHHAPAVR